jgi:hypothetical protein
LNVRCENGLGTRTVLATLVALRIHDAQPLRPHDMPTYIQYTHAQTHTNTLRACVCARACVCVCVCLYTRRAASPHVSCLPLFHLSILPHHPTPLHFRCLSDVFPCVHTMSSRVCIRSTRVRMCVCDQRLCAVRGGRAGGHETKKRNYNDVNQSGTNRMRIIHECEYGSVKSVISQQSGCILPQYSSNQ